MSGRRASLDIINCEPFGNPLAPRVVAGGSILWGYPGLLALKRAALQDRKPIFYRDLVAARSAGNASGLVVDRTSGRVS
jgi:hypothetical protein